MPDWIDNPHAGFVMAAYAVAFVVLAGAGIVFWRDYRRRVGEWRKIRGDGKA